MDLLQINTNDAKYLHFTENNITVNNLKITLSDVAEFNGNIITAKNQKDNYPITIIDSNEPIMENNITILTDRPTTAILLENCVSEIYENTIIVNTTNDETPIIDASNSPESVIIANYIESLDLCGDEAVMTEGEAVDNYPNSEYGGFYSFINISKDSIAENIPTKIDISVTDIFGREITGEITARVNGEKIEVIDKYILITANNTDEIIIVIEYSDPDDKYYAEGLIKTLTVIPPTLTIDSITTTAGETINITARITADNQTLDNINKGKVTFKVNGKTLKDINGKIIYAKVVNGTATIENYLVPSEWIKEGTTIQAVYSGLTECSKLTSEKQTLL